MFLSKKKKERKGRKKVSAFGHLVAGPSSLFLSVGVEEWIYLYVYRPGSEKGIGRGKRKYIDCLSLSLFSQHSNQFAVDTFPCEEEEKDEKTTPLCSKKKGDPPLIRVEVKSEYFLYSFNRRHKQSQSQKERGKLYKKEWKALLLLKTEREPPFIFNFQ